MIQYIRSMSEFEIIAWFAVIWSVSCVIIGYLMSRHQGPTIW